MHSNEAALTDQAVRAVDRGHAVNSELTDTVGVETGLAASAELTAKVGVIAGRAANPGELATVGPEFGAHLPDQQADSRSGQAHLTTSTSSAHVDEP